MPHFSCVITKPDGTTKNSSATGKDMASARKYAEEQHPGCKISNLKLRAPIVKTKTTGTSVSSVKPTASLVSSPKLEPVALQQTIPLPIEADGAESVKIKPNPKATTSIVDRLFYLQHGKCFYCGNHLQRADASLDHLHPKSKGGSNGDDNLVVCCKKINLVFNDMSIKDKIAFLMADPGGVTCPEDIIFTVRPIRSAK